MWWQWVWKTIIFLAIPPGIWSLSAPTRMETARLQWELRVLITGRPKRGFKMHIRGQSDEEGYLVTAWGRSLWGDNFWMRRHLRQVKEKPHGYLENEAGVAWASECGKDQEALFEEPLGQGTYVRLFLVRQKFSYNWLQEGKRPGLDGKSPSRLMKSTCKF